MIEPPIDERYELAAVKESLTADERKAAEHAYTVSAFDYEKAPVGSRDWTLFWSGWCARATQPSKAQPPCGADDELVTDICNAYESGVGHRGRPTADVNPYPPDAPQYRVYQLGALNNDDVPDEKWAFMSLKLIEQKEVQVPESFVEYMRKNYPEGTVIADGAWHARPIWNAARHAMLASQPAAPVAPATVAVPDGYYLACFRHSSPGKALWWGPNWAGYTPYLEQAGLYTEEELRGRGYFEEREDVPVPASFARGLAVSLIDTGHAKARPFNNASDLRAALAASQREGGGT